jgi:hypothetical protein
LEIMRVERHLGSSHEYSKRCQKELLCGNGADNGRNVPANTISQCTSSALIYIFTTILYFTPTKSIEKKH